MTVAAVNFVVVVAAVIAVAACFAVVGFVQKAYSVNLWKMVAYCHRLDFAVIMGTVDCRCPSSMTTAEDLVDLVLLNLFDSYRLES